VPGQVNIKHLLDHPRVTFVEGSAIDLDSSTFPDADGIFHQAAIPSVPRSVKDPLTSNEASVGDWIETVSTHIPRHQGSSLIKV